MHAAVTSSELLFRFVTHDFSSTAPAEAKSLRRDFPEVKWHTFEEWARKQDWSVSIKARAKPRLPVRMIARV